MRVLALSSFISLTIFLPPFQFTINDCFLEIVQVVPGARAECVEGSAHLRNYFLFGLRPDGLGVTIRHDVVPGKRDLEAASLSPPEYGGPH